MSRLLGSGSIWQEAASRNRQPAAAADPMAGVIQGAYHPYGCIWTLSIADGWDWAAGSGAGGASGQTICHVLAEDADLAAAVPPAKRNQAIDECIAAVSRLQPGPWRGAQTKPMSDGIGLLVLQGTLIREVRLGAGLAAELLGKGDLLRPWQGVEADLPGTSEWRVLEPARLAVLDLLVARRFARYPELTGLLAGRALARSRNLAMNMAIVQQARVQVRVHMMLWHLAERWGRVVREGTLLPLRLTHEVLAQLVASRRPTVSSALAGLAKEGLVRRPPQGWLLLGAPPRELIELREGPREA